MVKDLLDFEGAVNSIFIIKSSSKGITVNNNSYYSLTLQDSSGSIDAKIFDSADSYDPNDLVPGKIVRIEGMVKEYKGHAQIIINELDVLEQSQVDLSTLIPSSPIPKEDLIKQLNLYLNMIKDNEIKQLTKKVIEDNFEAYTTYPAATSFHHAYFSGLLFHSISICSNAVEIIKQYPFLNQDYLICGSLLHDIGKTKELSAPIAPTYTVEGHLLGHINIGFAMVYEQGMKLKINNEKLNNILHIILAHHGKPEYGSPKVPLTAEAKLIHVLDDLDAKMNMFEDNLGSVVEGGFSQKIIPLESIIYKPVDHNKSDNDGK